MRWKILSVAFGFLVFTAIPTASEASAPSEFCAFANTSTRNTLHQSLQRLLEIANELAKNGDRTALQHLTKAEISKGVLSGEQAAARDLRRMVLLLERDGKPRHPLPDYDDAAGATQQEIDEAQALNRRNTSWVFDGFAGILLLAGERGFAADLMPVLMSHADAGHLPKLFVEFSQLGRWMALPEQWHRDLSVLYLCRSDEVFNHPDVRTGFLSISDSFTSHIPDTELAPDRLRFWSAQHALTVLSGGHPPSQFKIETSLKLLLSVEKSAPDSLRKAVIEQAFQTANQFPDRTEYGFPARAYGYFNLIQSLLRLQHTDVTQELIRSLEQFESSVDRSPLGPEDGHPISMPRAFIDHVRARVLEDQTGTTIPTPYRPEICRSVEPPQTRFDIFEIRKDAFRVAGQLIQVQEEPMLQKVFSKQTSRTNIGAEKFLELASAVIGKNSRSMILLKPYSFPDVKAVTREEALADAREFLNRVEALVYARPIQTETIYALSDIHRLRRILGRTLAYDAVEEEKRWSVRVLCLTTTFIQANRQGDISENALDSARRLVSSAEGAPVSLYKWAVRHHFNYLQQTERHAFDLVLTSSRLYRSRLAVLTPELNRRIIHWSQDIAASAPLRTEDDDPARLLAYQNLVDGILNTKQLKMSEELEESFNAYRDTLKNTNLRTEEFWYNESEAKYQAYILERIRKMRSE